jgi:flagellar biosynthesis protein FlhG
MLLANMVKNSSEAREVFLKVSNATSHFLNLSIENLGYVLDDTRVSDAVRRQRALAEVYPDAGASKCLESVARKLCKRQPGAGESGSLKFFWKSVGEKMPGQGDT